MTGSRHCARSKSTGVTSQPTNHRVREKPSPTGAVQTNIDPCPGRGLGAVTPFTEITTRPNRGCRRRGAATLDVAVERCTVATGEAYRIADLLYRWRRRFCAGWLLPPEDLPPSPSCAWRCWRSASAKPALSPSMPSGSWSRSGTTGRVMWRPARCSAASAAVDGRPRLRVALGGPKSNA